MPAITVKSSIINEEATIARKNAYESHRTLGFQAQPINTYKDQLAILRNKSSQVLRALLTHKLDASTAHNAYHSVFVPRISYVFPFCGLSQAQLSSTQSGPLSYTLQAMGYPKTFPRDMVFLPKAYGGIGLNELFTEQGIANILFMIRHLRQDSELGKFLRITMRWAQITAGTGRLILHDTTTHLPHLTSKWIAQLRQFLSTVKGRLLLPHEPTPQTQREHDSFLMDIALASSLKPKQIIRINRVRIYLQVARLSDISTISGTHLSQPAREMTSPQDMPSRSTNLWPKQRKPGKQSWREWRTFLSQITTDDHKLRQQLGKWTTVDATRKWQARWDPEEHHLYVKHNNQWRLYFHPDSDSRRISIHNSAFDDTAHCPPHALPVMPSPRRQYDYSTPTGHTIPQEPLLAATWDQFRLQLAPWEADLLRFTAEVTETERLLRFLSIQDRTLYIVSDGGCKDDRGSFGWVIASETEVLWKGWGTARGHPMSSYRAEAYGRLAREGFGQRCGVSRKFGS